VDREYSTSTIENCIDAIQYLQMWTRQGEETDTSVDWSYQKSFMLPQHNDPNVAILATEFKAAEFVKSRTTNIITGNVATF
jgi:hypothetical protein